MPLPPELSLAVCAFLDIYAIRRFQETHAALRRALKKNPRVAWRACVHDMFTGYGVDGVPHWLILPLRIVVSSSFLCTFEDYCFCADLLFTTPLTYMICCRTHAEFVYCLDHMPNMMRCYSSNWTAIRNDEHGALNFYLMGRQMIVSQYMDIEGVKGLIKKF